MTARRHGLVAGLLAFAAFVALSLVRGAPFLELPLAGSLPLGNVLAAAGLCALPAAAALLGRPGTAHRAASTAVLVAAVPWLPASVALAGNLQLNFGDGRGTAWLVLSLSVLAAGCVVLLWALAAPALARARPRRRGQPRGPR